MNAMESELDEMHPEADSADEATGEDSEEEWREFFESVDESEDSTADVGMVMPSTYWGLASAVGIAAGLLVGVSTFDAVGTSTVAAAIAAMSTVGMFLATVTVAAAGWRLGRRSPA